MDFRNQIQKIITEKITNYLICIEKSISLASSVSHYGTEKAIEKFENYKKNGAVIRKEYLDKEITKEEFEDWIQKSKKQ